MSFSLTDGGLAKGEGVSAFSSDAAEAIMYAIAAPPTTASSIAAEAA
jgi:hypothetical protein